MKGSAKLLCQKRVSRNAWRLSTRLISIHDYLDSLTKAVAINNIYLTGPTATLQEPNGIELIAFFIF